MTVPSTHFEAKKHAYRQTQDGVVISFVVHPNDLNAALAVAPLGTRYMVAVAQIGDDDQPVPPGVKSARVDSSSLHEGSLKVADGPLVAPTSTETAVAPGGRTYTLANKIGMLCNDPVFQAWIAERQEIEPAAVDAEYAATYVRRYCGVKSRAEIKPGSDALWQWNELALAFEAATNRMAEQRNG